MTEVQVCACRRQFTWRYRLFFAIGCVLADSNWLTLLPELWWSDINRNAAAGLTVWYSFAQVVAFRLLWRWLGPLMQGERLRE